jgi:hypothetical protein
VRLKFPEAIKLIDDRARFEDVFLDELQQQEGNLELHRFCQEGGWPDDDTLELVIDSITKRRGRTVVRVSCNFEEAMSTGCSDVHRSENAGGTFDVILDPPDEDGEVDYDIA